MIGPPTLTGDRVTLRAPLERDIEDRLHVGIVPEYVLMCGGDPGTSAPLSPDQAQAWYDRIAAEPYGWCIEVAGLCVGTARLHSLRAQERHARYAVGIFDPQAWNKGYGTEATRLVLGYAFEVLALHRVDLRVLSFNERAIACYRKCGFAQEGIERESALISGMWYSDVMMSILEQEYRRSLAPQRVQGPSSEGTGQREDDQ